MHIERKSEEGDAREDAELLGSRAGADSRDAPDFNPRWKSSTPSEKRPRGYCHWLTFLLATMIAAIMLFFLFSTSMGLLKEGPKPGPHPEAEAPSVPEVPQAPQAPEKPVMHEAEEPVPDRTPNVLDPKAIDAQSVCHGYQAYDVYENDLGLTAKLELMTAHCDVYGIDIEELTLNVQYQTANRLSISISPTNLDASNRSHYILSEELYPRPTADRNAKNAQVDSDLEFQWYNWPSFSFVVLRRSTGDLLFNSSQRALIFEDQFVEFVTELPQNYNIYGLGERMHSLRLHDDLTATMFNADIGDPLDRNLYGTHPFYMDTRYYSRDDEGHFTLLSGESNPNVEYESYSHGVWLRNAHAQEVVLGKTKATWRTLGGSIDLFIFDGPTPAEVTKHYQQGAVGLPAMQQYWTFGYHQCRWGYKSWDHLQEIVDEMRKNDIPLETIWNDIDYMQNYRDFTTDKDNYPVPKGKEFLSKLHKGGQHYVPIIDAGIYYPDPKNESDEYGPFSRGKEVDAFIKNPDGSLHIGEVWPGNTVWPDMQSLHAIQWWVDECKKLYSDISFDGLWIDMNEAANGCNGSCHSTEISTRHEEDAKPGPSRNRINYPPYVINNVAGEITGSAIAPDAIHPSSGIAEYDVHNLFGHQLLSATYVALSTIDPKKRPFIIGRSTFAGSGAIAGHWGGDNWSEWTYLYFSIPQALSFSLFGIPMFGVDTCGFMLNTTEELCNRWMQLGAFMPFYRNHNHRKSEDQEPYTWPSVAEASRTAMSIRYALLPYLYTLFQDAHTTGSTVLRALAWEFPNDPNLVAADRQFMLGPSLLVTPVLVEGATTVDGVFPGDEPWYNWYTGKEETVDKGENKTLDAPLGHIPLHARGGSVLPLQAPGYTTAESRKNPWSLVVALSKDGSAAGSLYIDDGESLEPEDSLALNFTVEHQKLQVHRNGTFDDVNALANVTIWGVGQWSNKATFNDGDISSTGRFDERNSVLTFENLNEVTKDGAWKHDWVLRWD